MVAGLLLGLSTLISSFSGLMFTVTAMLFEGIGVLRSADVRRAIAHAVAAAFPIGAATALVLALGYVDSGGSVLMFGLNPVAATSFFLSTFLSIGPVRSSAPRPLRWRGANASQTWACSPCSR